MTWRASEAELIWQGEYPASVVEKVRADFEKNLAHLPSAFNLVCHIIFLTDEDDGPSVVVHGVEGSDALYCEYLPETVWVPFDGANEVPFQ